MYVNRKRQNEPNEMTIYDQVACNEFVCKAFIVVVIVVVGSRTTLVHVELGVTFQHILNYMSYFDTLTIRSDVAPKS